MDYDKLREALAKRGFDETQTEKAIETVYGFDVTKCDIKSRARWTYQTTLGVHGTRCRDAVECAALPHRRACQHRDHAHVRATAPPDGDARRVGRAANEVG